MLESAALHATPDVDLLSAVPLDELNELATAHQLSPPLTPASAPPNELTTLTTLDLATSSPLVAFTDALPASAIELETNIELSPKEIALLAGVGWRHGRLKNVCDICGHEHLTGFCQTKGIKKPRAKRTTCYNGCLDKDGRRARHGLDGCRRLLPAPETT